jgi:hypothetical protein
MPPRVLQLQVTEADLGDYLHLSFNSSSAKVPERAVKVLRVCNSARLPASEALALLHTAVERSHGAILDSHVEVLKRIPGALNSLACLTTEQLQPVIQRCCATFHISSHRTIEYLLALPAAKQLPADAIVALVNMALMKNWHSFDVCQFLQLPAAMHISPGELASIVEMAVAAHNSTILIRLSQIPAYDHLEPAAAAAAMLVVAADGSMTSLGQLLHSKSATGVDVLVPALIQQLCSKTDINSEPRYKLAILLAKATGQRQALSPLQVADTAMFSPDALLQVLEAAVVHNRPAFQRLWPLSAATVQARQLGQLLRCAAACHTADFQHVSEIVLKYFQRHHAWSSISEADKMVWLLRQAVQAGDDCSRYCAGPGAAAVDQQPAARLLEVAVATQHSGNLEVLLLLPAANQLGAWKVKQLLQMAVTATVHTHAANAYKKSLDIWYSALGSDNAAAAGDLCSSEQAAAAASRCLSVLCQWQAAAGACVGILSSLLRSSAQVDRAGASCVHVMQQICSSEAAAGISSTQLQSLLAIALSHRLCSSARALLHCPATADITATMLGETLQGAFSCYGVDAAWRSLAADGIGQRSNSSGVVNAATPSVTYLASSLAAASRSAGQQQHVGQSLLIFDDGAAAVGASGAAVASEQKTASTDAALTASQQCMGSPSEQLLLQLHAAVQRRDGARAAALCSCPAAAQLSHSTVRELLLAAAGELPPKRLFIAAVEESKDGSASPAARSPSAVGGSHDQFTASSKSAPAVSSWSIAEPQQVPAPDFAFGASMPPGVVFGASMAPGFVFGATMPSAVKKGP